MTKPIPERDIESVAVIGSGFMGRGIAESAARAGIAVTMIRRFGRRARGRPRGRSASHSSARSRAASSRRATSAALERISGSPRSAPRRTSRSSIEAVSEELELKLAVFSELDALLDDAIIASNTSSIPIASSRPATDRPKRPRAALLLAGGGDEAGRDRGGAGHERGDGGAARGTRRADGQDPILTKDRSGFIVNMLLVPYLMAAVRMYEDGFARARTSTRA